MLNKLSFQNKIYVYYSLIVVIIILAVTTVFYTYMRNTLLFQASNNMKQLVNKISSQLDSMVREIDIISTQVMFSSEIQKIMLQADEHRNENVNYFDINHKDLGKVVDILVSINSPKVIARRISLFNNNLDFVSVGNVSSSPRAVIENFKKADWIQDAVSMNGKYILIPPHKDDWLDAKETAMVISLSRTINLTLSGTGNGTAGIIEVQQPYSMLESICKVQDNSSVKIVIFDNDGQMIYPVNTISDSELQYYRHNILTIKENIDATILKIPATGSEVLAVANTSGITGWSIVAAQPKNDFLYPLYLMQNIIIAAGFLLILLTLVIIFFVNRNLTAPIRALRSSVSNVGLENLSLELNIDTQNNELVLLHEAFEKMLIRLKDSINQTMQARAGEMHAHFLALQAQINPHFIHNTLMGVCAMANKLGSQDIVSTCTGLSEMLRYTASYEDSHVTLTDELDYAENYLRLYKFRYRERLNYTIDIDREMSGIKVPKLIIQPFIENSIYHGFINTRPPWEIIIGGKITDKHWIINVSDNGSGFDESDIEKIMSRINVYRNELLNGKILNKLEMGGMGVINIFVRLLLLYGDDLIFKIENNSGCGASISIGGPV